MAPARPSIPVTYEEAVALALEIGESLGGRQQEALRVLTRFAARGRKPSVANITSAQHFAAARVELDAGLAVMGTVAALREEDPEEP